MARPKLTTPKRKKGNPTKHRLGMALPENRGITPIKDRPLTEFSPGELPEAPDSFYAHHAMGDSAKQSAFLQQIMEGNFLSVASRYVGIQPDTIRKALNDGRKGVHRGLHEFYLGYISAEAYSESHLVGKVREAADRDWRAAIVLLQSRYKERWGKERNNNDGNNNAQALIDNRRLVSIQLTDAPESKDLVRELVNSMASSRTPLPDPGTSGNTFDQED